MAILFGVGIVSYITIIIVGALGNTKSSKKMSKKGWAGIGVFALGILMIIVDAATNAGGAIALLLGMPMFVGGLVYGMWNQ